MLPLHLPQSTTLTDRTASRPLRSKCVLPHDVLDKIFEALLPEMVEINVRFKPPKPAGYERGQIIWPVRGEQDEQSEQESQDHELTHFPDETVFARSHPGIPHDLLRCRLSCHDFYDLASRWVWRRVDSRKLCKSGKEEEVFTYLESSPEAAGYIRFLIIPSASLEKEHSIWYKIMPLLTNIRAVQLYCGYWEDMNERKRVPPDFFSLLLANPSLHTLMLDGLNVPDLSLPIASTLKRLHIECLADPKLKLLNLSLLHSLEYLDYEESDDWVYEKNHSTPTALDIPWHSLKEFSLRSTFEHFQSVAESFKSWKESAPGIASPLTELSLYRTNMVDPQSNAEEFASTLPLVLEAFGGQNLTKLIVLEISEMSNDIFHQIATTFPNLRELRLGYEIEWEDLWDYCRRTLEEFKFLKFLEWDFIKPANDRMDIILGCAEMLQYASRQCPSLRRFNFVVGPRVRGCTNGYDFSLARDDETGDHWQGDIVLPIFYDPKSEDPFVYMHPVGARFGEHATNGWGISNFPDV